MVARNYDRCVLVEILLLNPGNELGDLLAGAVQNHSVLVVTVVFFIAELTRISILKMGVCGQHGEVERLSLCCDFGQTVFGKGKEFFILIAPPFVISFRDQAFFHSPVVIVYFVVAVLFKVLFPAAELSD